jgi:very-short-patch-repair endonuclease
MPSLKLEMLSKLREKLLDYRKRLLDLSLRNKLLNWKPSKRFTLNLSGLSLTDAYAAVLDNEGAVVDIVPEYDKAAYEEWGKAIPDRSGLNSDLNEEALAAKCLLSRRETDALERDSGINHCHLILGFLEWYDDKGPTKALRAPVILVPVKLEKSGINRVTRVAEYTLAYDQTETIVNPCLAERLKDFNIAMPKFLTEEGDAPDAEGVAQFLRELEDLAKSKPNWKLVHEIKVSFLSFAKLRMWRDLDPNEWPEDDRLENKQLIQALFGFAAANDGADGVTTGRSIEEDLKADSIPLVVSADSSQHRAIADACRGVNLVIQGPPGTGKSQTITNLIAALMHQGKSVLFVAEKLPALDVVKRNLESVGLGAFCMELHGTKASKPAVYAELRSRLEQTFNHPPLLANVRKDWEEKRKILNRYVEAASKRIGPNDETYFEIVGKVERLRSKGISPTLELAGVGVAGEKFGEKDQYFAEIQQLLMDRNMPRSHAWSDLDAGDLDTGNEDNLIQPLNRVIELLDYLVRAESFVNQTLKTSVELRLEDIIGLTAGKLTPFAISNSVIWTAKDALSSKANRSTVAGCKREADDIRSTEDQLSQRLSFNMRKQVPTSAPQTADSVSEYAIHVTPIRHIQVEAYQQLAEAVKRLHPLLEAADRFGLGPVPNLGEVPRLQSRLATLRKAEGLISSDLEPGLFQPGLGAILMRAKTSSQEFSARRQALSQTFSVVGDLPSASELHRVRDDLKAYGSSLLGRIFSGKYRAAKNDTLRWISVPSAYKYPDIIPQLELMERLSSEESASVAEPTNQKLGALFKGVGTDWARMETVVAFAETARSSDLGYENVKALVESGNLKDLAALHDKLEAAWPKIERLTSAVAASGTVSSEYLMVSPWPEVDATLTQWHVWLSSQILPLQSISLPDDMSLKDLAVALREWETIDQRKSTLLSNPKLRACLGDEAAGVETNWQKVTAAETWLDAMGKVGMPKPWFQGLLQEESQAVWAQVVELIAQAAGVWEQLLSTFTTFEPHLKDATSWIKKHVTPALSQKVSMLVAEGDMLPTWAHYCRLRRRGDELGVRPYLDQWQSGHLPADQLSDMFRLVEYRRLAAQEVKSSSALRGFSIESHEQARIKFQKLDDELTRLSQQEIAATIASRDFPEGHNRGPRGDWTDGALIRHQVSLQRRQAPLRVLVSRAHQALVALKPCMMMSPLTVAQFLSPNLPPFDVLVYDEASQILPEDALGAIARAKQIIVVGDPKQLPPTGFFKVAADDEGDEDDESLMEGGESILDVCEAAFGGRTRRLKWHYRSLHESLIAFSNEEFYDGELLIFPSPIRDASQYGVRFHKVEGLYQNNRNEIEARAVIDAVIQQLRSDSSKSLGIVTFNLKQKELLEDLLAAEGQEDPLLAELMERADQGQEPLIIRNLESIQGEQRDIIFISCNFGPETPGGATAQRFGPLNGKNGWRRLNVMFSRAKERMEVYSSMYADAITAEPGAQTGAAYLSRFLRYAQTGILDQSRPSGREPDSDFERSVADFIRKEGFEVTPQVGVAGFFIDMAVSQPGRTNRYMIGIECDGASYHSSRVARDRDKIREAVLRGRGWNIYRIWSTDWFQNRTGAMKRLSAALNAAAS